MIIVVGASGRVGGAVIDKLVEGGTQVRGIIRNPEDAKALADKGAQVGIADLMDKDALATACKGGTAIFVITPESEKSNDILADTNLILENYRHAIRQNGIKKIVGLSSMGADEAEGNGNLGMSHLLEHAFDEDDVQKIFIRPAYYYSNWLPGLEAVKEGGPLMTFFPVDTAIPMVSPVDVGTFAAEVLSSPEPRDQVITVTGPDSLSSADVARIAGEVLEKEVSVQQIPENKWGTTLEDMGFSIDATKNFVEMTKFTIDRIGVETIDTSKIIQQPTSLRAYLTDELKH